MEIVVVDGGSTDGTIEVLRKIAEQVGSRVKLTVVEGKLFRGKANQINEGIRIANSSHIITTDADCRIDSNSIEILVGSLSANGVGAVCARQVLTNPNESAITETEVTYRNYYERIRIAESNLHSTPIFHGGLSAYRKDAVSKIDEDLNADDTQLAIAAVRNGFRAIYNPNAIFYAKAPSNIRESWSQRVRRGQGLQRAFWRNRKMIVARKFGAFGFPILAAEFYMHIISPPLFIVAISLSAGLAAYLAWRALGLILLPLGAVLAGLAYWKRSSFPLLFAASFAYYQTALLCASVLHLLGSNYSRWSRNVAT